MSTQPGGNLTGVSIDGGAVVSSARLPVQMVDTDTYGGIIIAFAANLGGRVIVAGDAADGTHLVGLLHPATGAWRLVASLPAADVSDQCGTGAYIPSLGLFVFDMIVYQPHGWHTNFAVNMSTGQYVNRSDPVSSGSSMAQRFLNPADEQVYGVGEQALDDDSPSQPWNRTVERMDPRSLKVDIMGVVPGGWQVQLGAAGAVGTDAEGGSIFWLGCKDCAGNASSKTDFFLVQNALRDASLLSVSTSAMCTGAGWPPSCPYSFAFFP